MDDILRKKQVDDLQLKLSEYLVKKLRYWLDIEGWQGVEVYRKWGWPSNRQTEAKKGRRPVSWPIMKTLIATRFVTLQDLEENVNMNEKEKSHLQQEFAPYNNPELHEVLVAFQRAGKSLTNLAKEYMEKHPEEFNEK